MVEYRLAKARVAGSNPVSRFYELSKDHGILLWSFFVYKNLLTGLSSKKNMKLIKK